MQSILFPMQTMRITQKYGVGTHKYGFPIDNGGKDTGIDPVFAPFDGVIKKKWAKGNSVWLESSAPVKFADGTVDYAVAMFTHDGNTSNLYVGQKIYQGQHFYDEGRNNAAANHLHLEIGRGKYSGTGWHAEHNQWVINNPYKPERAFFLKDTNVVNGAGLPWVRYSQPTPPSKTKDSLTASGLGVNESLVSQNGKYTAIMQSDGNFVVYNGKKAIWATNTMKSGAKRAEMQTDGNFVLYNGSKPIWASNSSKKGGKTLLMQNDGNLVIYTASNKPIWATNTSGK